MFNIVFDCYCFFFIETRPECIILRHVKVLRVLRNVSRTRMDKGRKIMFVEFQVNHENTSKLNIFISDGLWWYLAIISRVIFQ